MARFCHLTNPVCRCGIDFSDATPIPEALGTTTVPLSRGSLVPTRCSLNMFSLPHQRPYTSILKFPCFDVGNGWETFSVGAAGGLKSDVDKKML